MKKSTIFFLFSFILVQSCPLQSMDNINKAKAVISKESLDDLHLCVKLLKIVAEGKDLNRSPHDILAEMLGSGESVVELCLRVLDSISALLTLDPSIRLKIVTEIFFEKIEKMLVSYNSKDQLYDALQKLDSDQNIIDFCNKYDLSKDDFRSILAWAILSYNLEGMDNESDFVNLSFLISYLKDPISIGLMHSSKGLLNIDEIVKIFKNLSTNSADRDNSSNNDEL